MVVLEGLPKSNWTKNFEGYDKVHIGKKMEILIRKKPNMSHQARISRAAKLGFDTNKIWYHGGFVNFESFDSKRSGSGTFNFASDKHFAESYAQTRSQDEGGDYDIVVRPFFLTKYLFDYNNKAHLQRLKRVLPNVISIQGNYGWSAWGKPCSYTKESLLEAIQTIGTPYTGLDEQAIKDIKSGKSSFKRDGSIEYVIDYDKAKGVVKYAPSYVMDAINGLKHQIAYYKKNDPTSFRIPQIKLDLRREEQKFKPYSLILYPQKTIGHDNWHIMESAELRPYFVKIGFEGTLMLERNKETCAVFYANRIRSVDAAFDIIDKQSNKLTAKS